MVVVSQPDVRTLGRPWVPLLVLGIALLLTLLCADFAAVSAKSKKRLQFESIEQEARDILPRRMAPYFVLHQGRPSPCVPRLPR